jgi:hypothetical protein
VSEEFLRHKVVGFNGGGDVGFVNTDRHTHQHVLWSFRNCAINTQEVRALERLEPEVVICVVAVVDDG